MSSMTMATPSAVASTTPGNTAVMNPGSLNSTPALESISIHDLETGKLDIDIIIHEVQELKSKITGLRYEMCRYIRLLSSIDESSIPSIAFQEIANQVNTLKANIDNYYTSYKRLLPVIRYAKLKIGLNPDDQIKIVQHEVKVETKSLMDSSNASKSETTTTTTNPLLASASAVDMQNKQSANSPPSGASTGTNNSATPTATTVTGGSMARKNSNTKKPAKPRASNKKAQQVTVATASQAQGQVPQQQGKSVTKQQQQNPKPGQGGSFGSANQPIVL